MICNATSFLAPTKLEPHGPDERITRFLSYHPSAAVRKTGSALRAAFASSLQLSCCKVLGDVLDSILVVLVVQLEGWFDLVGCWFSGSSVLVAADLVMITK
jgi:hypothetical protein